MKIRNAFALLVFVAVALSPLYWMALDAGL